MQTSDYFNTQQAAAHLQISASTLNKRRVFGDGPPFVKMGRSVRYRRSDLDAWTATRLRKSTSDDGSDKPPFGSPAHKTETKQPRNPAQTMKRRGAAEPAP